jgi:site-specific recombinase XerD
MTGPDGLWRHLREWFTVFLPRQRGAAQQTITSCRHTWNMLLAHVAETRGVPAGKITFAMLDRQAVAGFLDHMRTTKQWAASTYNQRLSCVRSFFAYAAQAEPTLTACHADLVAIPRLKSPAPLVGRMSTAAVAALLAAPDPSTRLGLRDQFFMVLMYDLAARDGEMLAMGFADLDPARMTVDLLGKGSKPRRLPVTTQTMAHYRRYAAVFHPAGDRSSPMFYTIHRGERTPMSDDNAARLIRQHADTARADCPDLPGRIHPHLLRHARALHLYQAGMPLAMLTEWLGHQDPETTLIYARADTEMKRQAIDKATGGNAHAPTPLPVWHGREDLIAQLCGLTL